MEQFKIDHFERDHGPGTFPSFRPLSSEETLVLVHRLWEHLQLTGDAFPEKLVKAIWQAATPVKEADAGDGSFKLLDLLQSLGFSSTGLAFLNWRHFESVDEVLTEDLCDQFSDVWYPSSDDLEIIDSDLRWILTVSHYGLISALRLG